MKKLDNKFFLNDMSDSDKKAIKDKYSKAIEQTISVFKDYADVQKKASVLSIKVEWEEYEHQFNAKSKRIENDEYVINLNLYTPVKLEMILSDKQVQDEYIYQIISTIITFILWHEIFHIIFGHCTIPKHMELSNDVRRKFETMCDLKGIENMLVDIYVVVNDKDKNTKKNMYASLMCSLFIYFYILENIELENNKEKLKNHEMLSRNNIEKTDNPYKTFTSNERSHPFTTFRFDLICCVIEQKIKDIEKLSDIDIDDIYKISIEDSEYFGFSELLKINPFYRRNKKSKINNIPHDLNILKQYVAKSYI